MAIVQMTIEIKICGCNDGDACVDCSVSSLAFMNAVAPDMEKLKNCKPEFHSFDRAVKGQNKRNALVHLLGNS